MKNLLDIKGTFADWVKENTEWLKTTISSKNNKILLTERLNKLKEEGVSISEEKIEQYKNRVKKAKDIYTLYSIFYHAAVSTGDTSLKEKRD